MVKNLQKICILSGPSVKVDTIRAETAVNYYDILKNHGEEVPFKILGAGLDLDLMLKYWESAKKDEIGPKEYNEKIDGLDHHLELFLFLKNHTNKKIETITSSVTLVENVLHGFRDEKEGSYAIVTELWHYKKFGIAERSLKRKGKISEGLWFFNIASLDTDYYNPFKKLASKMKTRLELMKI